MKKLFLAALAMTFALAACSSEDREEDLNGSSPNGHPARVAKNISGADDVAEVRVMAIYSSENRASEEIASTEFTDNGFAINLPLNVAANKLQFITPAVLNLPGGVTMKPSSFEGFIAGFWGYNSNGEEVGSFELQDANNPMNAVGRYYYSNNEVRITGAHMDSQGNEWMYDVSLIEGWNIVYQQQEDVSLGGFRTRRITMTTRDIATVDWFYYRIPR